MNAEPGYDPARDPPVLLLAPTGRDAELTVQALAERGIQCDTHTGLEDFLEAMGPDCGPIIVAEEALSHEGAAAFHDRLEEQPPWSDLPVIIILSTQTRPERIGPLAQRRNTTLVRRPMEATTFTGIVEPAVDARRRQHEVRDLLRHLEELNQRLEERAGQLRNLAVELTESEERERQRLAGILHDDLQQILVGIRLKAERIPLSDDESPGKQQAGELMDLVDRAVEVSRNLSHDLSAPVLGQEGLAAALRGLRDRMATLHGLRVDLEVEADVEPPDKGVRTFLFRSVQELLLNVVKHAGTDRAQVTLRCVDDQCEVEVREEGRGFDPTESGLDSASEGGSGLARIRERAKVMGGSMEVEAAPDEGSTIRLRVPLHPDPHPA